MLTPTARLVVVVVEVVQCFGVLALYNATINYVFGILTCGSKQCIICNMHVDV